MNRIKSKQWIILILLVALASSSCCGSTITTGNGTPTTAPVLGALAPNFTLSTIDGSTVELDELRGKPVILNFWATWCVYCAEEMRYFNAVAKQSADEITVVAIDVGQDASKVKQYFGDYEISFTVALDEDSHVASMYAVRYFPTTFFIDSEGVIRNRKIGAFRSEMELWDSLRGLS